MSDPLRLTQTAGGSGDDHQDGAFLRRSDYEGIVGDGITNKMRFAMGMAAFARFTPLDYAAPLADGRPAFCFTRNAESGEAEILIEASYNLLDWHSGSAWYDANIQ